MEANQLTLVAESIEVAAAEAQVKITGAPPSVIGFPSGPGSSTMTSQEHAKFGTKMETYIDGPVLRQRHSQQF